MTFTGTLRRMGIVSMAAATIVAFWPEDADARAGRGLSFGSRGTRTFQAPPPTNTAPRTTAPIQRSITQPGQKTTSAARPAARPATPSLASRFGGWRGILMGGLIAAALASFLGTGALASMLGSLLWFGLIAGALYLIMGLFRGRSPAMAGGPNAPQARSTDDHLNRRAAMAGGAGAAGGFAIAGADYDAFERLLGEIQTAYGKNDVDALSTRTTPEMLSYFAEELDNLDRNGQLNLVSNVKLLQGDLAESWQEDHAEYATVAMRYSLTDAVVDAATGKLVAGSRTEPQEVTEVWTFARPRNGSASQWELSAIQQAA